MRFSSRRVLVTGGLGFIGSNVARQLEHEGARVWIVDSRVEGCGANPENIRGLSRVDWIEADIGEPERFRTVLRDCDLILNLAGEISHIDSMANPDRDLRLNATANLRFLEGCRRECPGVRVVYASTRQVYGAPLYLPVDENHPIHPVDYNGVHKYAAGHYHLMLTRKGDLDAIVLRLTNVYGPRMSLTAPKQGFLSAFLRALMLGQRLRIFGDGRQLRDPVYVDDVVEAFLRAALLERPEERTFNVGGGEHLELREIARVASRLADAPEPELTPFPPELLRIDIGSYFTDPSRFHRATGWKATVGFEEGFRRTLDFYRADPVPYLPEAVMVRA
jgi:UDP-glucose 4-epimerase